jgi:GTP pyrophosphokinase
MYDPERRIDVEWDTGDDPSAPYTVRLNIQVEDRKGMLAAISSQVSAINTNIRTMEATTSQEQGFIDMTVEIQDVKHLDKVIRAVKGIPGVLAVDRTGGGRTEERAS